MNRNPDFILCIAYSTCRVGTWPLHDIAITNIVCGMATQGGAGGDHVLRNIDCKVQRGGGGIAIKEVLNAKNGID